MTPRAGGSGSAGGGGKGPRRISPGEGGEPGSRSGRGPGRGAPGPDVEGAARVLRERIGDRGRVQIVLGSGLGGLADAVEDAVAVPFEALPGLPPAGVEGHAGCFVGGLLEGVPVLLQAGRYHLYEGHPREVVAAPVRIGASAGARVLLLTNAAGGIDRRLAPGSLLLLDDHVNLQFRSVLLGTVRGEEERFPDLSAPYDPGLQDLALEAAVDAGVSLIRGVYAAVTGPSYETPAEIRMLERLGVDVVGMSTVPEVIAARARGLRVAAISLVTNFASGITPDPLSHEEVREVGRRAGPRIEAVVRGLVRRLEWSGGWGPEREEAGGGEGER